MLTTEVYKSSRAYTGMVAKNERGVEVGVIFKNASATARNCPWHVQVGIGARSRDLIGSFSKLSDAVAALEREVVR